MGESLKILPPDRKLLKCTGAWLPRDVRLMSSVSQRERGTLRGMSWLSRLELVLCHLWPGEETLMDAVLARTTWTTGNFVE